MSKPPDPSELRTLLILEREQSEPEERDDFSTEKDDWVGFGTAMADIRWGAGNERFDADQMRTIQSAKIWIRYRNGLQTTDRLNDRDGGAIFNINAIQDWENRRKWLIIDVVQA